MAEDHPAPKTETTPEEKAPLQSQPNNPLHGITLKVMLTELIEEIGWEEIAYETGVRNFTDRPTLPSGLKFLRKTPWAREKFERLYLRQLRKRG